MCLSVGLNVKALSEQASWRRAYLIFVTDVTDGVCGEKLFMWRNSPHDMLSSGKFLHMINVGKLCHMGKFLHITNVGKICQVENFST